jgi:hypothetical protein
MVAATAVAAPTIRHFDSRSPLAANKRWRISLENAGRDNVLMDPLVPPQEEIRMVGL